MSSLVFIKNDAGLYLLIYAIFNWQLQYFQRTSIYSISMPMNIFLERPLLSNSQQPKNNRNTNSCHSNRNCKFKTLTPHNSDKNAVNQNSKHSSSKNHLKNPRNHCFQTLGLRAMLKKAKEVSPRQTFLPPKTSRLLSGVSNRLQTIQTRKKIQAIYRLGMELDRNRRQQVISANKCQISKSRDTQKYENDEQNTFQQLTKEEMGSLSQIIFFGDTPQTQDFKIVLLKQTISKGGELQCLQLLNQLQKC